MVERYLFVPFFFVLTLLLFALAIRRVLGVRLGVLRTVLATLAAVLLGQPIMQAMLADLEQADGGSQVVYLLLSIATTSLLAMILVVLAEVLVPDGSLPSPLELWRGSRSRLRRARRYGQVIRIALRHGLGRFLRGRDHRGLSSSVARRELARSLRAALDEGGITFVKLGQQLSTRRDLLPAEFTDELTGLQDRAAPVPWPDVQALLAAELPDLGALAEIDPEPLAAASVAQVHSGRLRDGREVIVKVQRPGLAAVVDRDLDILARLAVTLESRTRWGRSIGARALAAGFAAALREELDFTVERDNMRSVGALLEPAPGNVVSVRVPRPLADLCTPRVLVMERLTGTPLGAADAVLAGWDAAERRAAADVLLGMVLDQVLVHGLFHVDLHPGNVLVGDDRVLGLLDFGSVGRLDSTTRAGIGRLLVAIGRGDSTTAADALLDLVDRPEEIDERALERAVGSLIVRWTTPGSTAGAAAFSALFRLVATYRLGIPPQVAAVFRAFATLEGTLAALDPGIDLLARTRAIGQTRMQHATAPGELRRSLEDELVSLLPLLRRLPRRVDRIADSLEHGRFGLRVRLLADPDDRRMITGMLHQTLLTVIGGSSGLMAVLLLRTPGGPRLTESFALFAVLGYALLIVAVVLALRILLVVFRQDPPT
jgi:ubiquinone biosynthesis protein